MVQLVPEEIRQCCINIRFAEREREQQREKEFAWIYTWDQISICVHSINDYMWAYVTCMFVFQKNVPTN